VLSDLFEAADRFTQGAPQQDDMTLLTLKINAI
jgi:serine phosphatase RsbU (regulator of sigma subunit)